MSSALVIGLFIQHSYKRQTEKHRDNRRFMVLTEAERSYFLDGIAAYMTANELQNQVTREQFDTAIVSLYRVIPNPEELSAKMSALRGEEVRPLNERLQDREDPLEAVKTDVRTYGILVTDFSRRNALRFPHKSFFEYLFANYVVRRLTGHDNVVSSAIWTATEAAPDKIIDMPESLSFAGELMSQSNGVSVHALEKSKLLKNLFNIIVRDGLPTALRPLGRIILIENGLRNHAYTRVRIFSPFEMIFNIIPLTSMFIFMSLSFIGLDNFTSIFFGEKTAVKFKTSISTQILFAFIMVSTFFGVVMRRLFLDSPLVRRRIVLWFLIAVSLGVRKKDIQRTYGKLPAEGLPRLVRRYKAGDVLDKFRYED